MDKESKTRVDVIEKAALAKFRDEINSIVSEFKSIYDKMPLKERAKLKAWLSELQSLSESAPKSKVHDAVRVEFASCSDEDSEQYSAMSVRAACDAIDCWDRGEQFTPTSMGWFF
jgi:hypothetical protein